MFFTNPQSKRTSKQSKIANPPIKIAQTLIPKQSQNHLSRTHPWQTTLSNQEAHPAFSPKQATTVQSLPSTNVHRRKALEWCQILQRSRISICVNNKGFHFD